MCPDQGLNMEPDMCPVWESNQPPLVYGLMIQPTEPHKPGQITYLFDAITFLYEMKVK